MKIRGHLPILGDEVEVNLLLFPNVIAWAFIMLAPYWEFAWKFKALWQHLLWQLGGLPPYCQ